MLSHGCISLLRRPRNQRARGTSRLGGEGTCSEVLASVRSEQVLIHFTVGEFVAQGDIVVVRSSMAWRNKRTGREVDTPKVDFWRFRDGKATEVYEYYDTAQVIAAACD